VLLTWLTAFAWTLAIELPIYTLIIGRFLPRWWSVVGLVFAINAVTHPLLWFAFPRLAPRWLYLATGEAAVIAIETLLVAVAIRHPGRAFVAAAAANATSWALGSLGWSLLAH
jgi:hypothetical protein